MISNYRTARIRLGMLLLLMALVLSVLSGCSGKQPPLDEPDSQQTTGSDPSVIIPEDEQTRFLPKKTDYKNYTYRMYMDGAESPDFFAFSEVVSNDSVNTALYLRTTLMQDYFNVNIELHADMKLSDSLMTYVSTGEDFADIVLLGARPLMMSAVPQGLLMDISQTNGLNLTASYWDQRIQSEYNINGSIYMLEGDFSVYDELRTMTVLYNAGIYETKLAEKYGKPYPMVNEGKWTYGRMMEMLQDTSDDLNGDGKMTAEDDLYGLYTECAGPYVFFLGSGMKPANVTDGLIKLMYSENYQSIYQIFETTMALCNNADTVLVDAANAIGYGAANTLFSSDHVLFRSTTLSSATSYRDMESDYGILPIPKYTETQDEYYCWVSASSSLPLSFPYTVKAHEETTVALTEALCYFSRYNPNGELTLYEAFFDRMTYNRLCRTPDDFAMLKIIFASKTYDLDSAAELTGIYGKLWDLAHDGNITTLSSTLSALEESSVSSLANYLSEWRAHRKQ